MLNKKVALLTASPALFSFLAKSLEPFVFLQQTLQAVHLLGNYQSFTLLLLFASLLWIGGKMNGYIIHKERKQGIRFPYRRDSNPHFLVWYKFLGTSKSKGPERPEIDPWKGTFSIVDRRIICSAIHPFDVGLEAFFSTYTLLLPLFKCTWLFFWPNRTLVLKGRCSSFDRRYEVSWWVNFFFHPCR